MSDSSAAWVDPVCGCERSPDVPAGTSCPTHPAAYTLRESQALRLRDEQIEAVADLLAMQPEQWGWPGGDYWRALAEAIIDTLNGLAGGGTE